MITHLLPNARAWRLTITKTLRSFFEGLTYIWTDPREFIDLVWKDIDPATTRELDMWEEQFDLPNRGLTESERRDRLAAAWKASGGQSPRYLQDTLQAAGFEVYIHEWWDPADVEWRNDWTPQTSSANENWRAVAWSESLGLFAAVASSGTNVMTSPDGENWTNRTAPDRNWRDVIWVEELTLFVAVGVDTVLDNVMTSPDGITWTLRNAVIAGDQWYGITWSPTVAGGRLVAVAAFGTNLVMTSPDGINWTGQSPASDNEWRTVAWSPDLSLFVAAASGGDGNRVMTSADGITWTSPFADAPRKWWNNLIWSAELGLFVAVGGIGPIRVGLMVSRDGLNWEERPVPLTNSWQDVAWSPELGLFVAVGDDLAITSPDGYAWTEQDSLPDRLWRSIAWAPSLNLFATVTDTDPGDVATLSGPATETACILPRDPQVFLDGSPGYVLADSRVIENVKSLVDAGQPNAEAGETFMLAGNFEIESTGSTPVPPSDPEKWAYFIYFSGETFPNPATVPAARREEFEKLCRKTAPGHLWLGIIVNYV